MNPVRVKSNQSALNSHQIQIAAGKVRNQLQPVANLIPNQMNEISRRHQRNSARAIGEIHRIRQTAVGKLADEINLTGDQFLIRSARRQNFNADDKLSGFQFLREPAVC